MKTILRVSIGSVILGVAAVLAFANLAAAQGVSVIYPVSELGNCTSEGECRTFCDSPDNREACIAFAERQGIIETGKANQMRAVTRLETDIMAKGPGGCVTREECDAFCRVEENLRECLSYGVNEGFMTQAEADDIIAKAERGGPGGCTSESECRAFCQDQTHARECLQFAANEGKISQEEADLLAQRAGTRPRPREPKEDIDVEKAQAVLSQGAGPGGCSTMDGCEAYCEDGTHMDECMSFAVEHGLAPAEQIKRMQTMMRGGPGGCQGPEACDAYCSTPEHGEECMRFTIENGLMDPEEIEQIKKEMEIVRKLNTGAVSGPGGCNSKETCSAYCADEAHVEECVQFAGRTGMMTAERVQTMMGRTEEARREMEIREGERMPEGFGGMPFQDLREVMPFQELREGMPPGDMMREIQQFMPPEGFVPPEGMYNPPSGDMGPPPGGEMGPPPGGEMAPPPEQSGSLLNTVREIFIEPFAKALGL